MSPLVTDESPDQAGGQIVLVSTPIGNLGDLSKRALEVLASADLICCEDTRRTRTLLSAFGVPAGGRLISMHAHNESARVPEVISRALQGQTVAVVSDAGAPTISDPGQILVAAAAAAGVRVTVVPGPSSVISALSVSGLPTERFCMEGFVPRRGRARSEFLDAIADEERTAVLMESALRLAATLNDLSLRCGDRQVVVVRELTKIHEEVWRGTVSDAVEVFSNRQVKGEVVLVLAGAPKASPPSDEQVADALQARMSAGDRAREAAEFVTCSLGVSRRRAYQLALDLQSRRSS